MSKLASLRQALQENPNIVIVDTKEKNYLPNRFGYWSQTVNFFVAPKFGLYTQKELQTLLVSLTPNLKPTDRDNFFELGHIIEFGKLYFDEVIGVETARHKIVITDKELPLSEEFVNGKLVTDRQQQLWRRSWVQLFPNIQIAMEARKGLNEYCIDKKILAKYR